MERLPGLEVRNLRFPIHSGIPRYWHGGRRSVTTFFDALSIFFPHGERFFVESVNAHRAHAVDPQLRADVRAFAGQEGIHSREHQGYNQMLRERGYPVDLMEERVGRLLDRVRRRTPKRWQLAATCALEHFTSLMGCLVLDDPRGLAGADPTMAALWRWHAAEECEHKHVAFEVFTAAGGTWAERTGIMLATTLVFWAKVVEHQARMMHTDGTLFSAEEWWQLFHFLFVDPGGMVRIIPGYLEYYRPGFHPSAIETRPLVEAWLEAYSSRQPLSAARGSGW